MSRYTPNQCRQVVLVAVRAVVGAPEGQRCAVASHGWPTDNTVQSSWFRVYNQAKSLPLLKRANGTLTLTILQFGTLWTAFQPWNLDLRTFVAAPPAEHIVMELLKLPGDAHCTAR